MGIHLKAQESKLNWNQICAIKRAKLEELLF